MKLTEYISKVFVDEDLLVSKENWYQDKNIKSYAPESFVEDIDVIKVIR